MGRESSIPVGNFSTSLSVCVEQLVFMLIRLFMYLWQCEKSVMSIKEDLCNKLFRRIVWRSWFASLVRIMRRISKMECNYDASRAIKRCRAPVVGMSLPLRIEPTADSLQQTSKGLHQPAHWPCVKVEDTSPADCNGSLHSVGKFHFWFCIASLLQVQVLRSKQLNGSETSRLS